MFDLLQNIRNKAVLIENKNHGILEIYMGVMRKSISGYNLKDIESQLSNPIYDYQDIFKGYSRIGMSRLLNVMAVLVKYGKLDGYYAFWDRLMKSILIDIEEEHKKSGVEFLVLELCTAIIIGKSFIHKEDYNGYIEKLSAIKPYEKYDSTLLHKTPDELHNFCMYGICAEYLRGYLTGTDTDDFIIRHWEVQKNKFDSEGRYMDPGCPLVYDITSRYRLALMLTFGYSGKASGEMKDILIKGAPGLLYQMSSDYKFPYGGRSNQFNFNETLVASMCEYYALEFEEKGDYTMAGVFREGAYKSIEGLNRWLNEKPARHIKNMFPIDSNYGIDSYGTYERYMGTMGTFLFVAVLFCKENSSRFTCPCTRGGYIYETGMDFHKLFASCCGYSVEVEKQGDSKYDATGLGRVHFTGAPAELVLAMPFSKEPGYKLGKFSNEKARSIGVFWNYNGKKEYLAESISSVETTISKETVVSVEFSMKYFISDRGNITEHYVINNLGLSIAAECDFSSISYCVPVFYSNGKDFGKIQISKGFCSVELADYVYEVAWNESLPAEYCDYLLYNRNGIYKELNIKNDTNNISINLCIKGVKNE